MPISVECRTCGAKLKVKDELAGKVGRCPHCKMGISIPKPIEKTDLELQDDLDFGLDEPVPARPKAKKTRAKAAVRDEDELDFVEEAVEEEEVLAVLPPKRRKKKPAKVERDDDEPEPDPHYSRGDWLVWVLLLAMIPLVISVVMPGPSLEDRLKKMTAKDPVLAEELEVYGALQFLDTHRDLAVEGSHLGRKSLLHWVYALAATVAFVLLLNAMRHRTTVAWWGLLLTGLFTGTIGIFMLFVFQIIAIIALHLNIIGGGIVIIIYLIIKFIGFSYWSALDPNSGFLWSFVGFTCGVGFCEEICKAIPVFVYLRNTRSSDWRGTCLLGFASGAGFGISEGIMYSTSHYNGIEPGLAYVVRFASCVALHAILSGGVALLMFGNQDYIDGDNEWMTFLYGWMSYIIIAMVLHGLYDTLLKQHLDALALFVAVGAFGWLAWITSYYWNYEPPPVREGIIY